MIKELRMVEGIPEIVNEVMAFNGIHFTLKQYDKQIINIVMHNGFARTCHENAVVNPQKCQYEKKNGYVITNFSKDSTDYKMLICESDNKVFIYRTSDFEIGDALIAIGVKTMEAPIEKINPHRPFDICDAFEYAYKTIKTMTDMNDDDACRLLYGEIMKHQNLSGRVSLTMKIFQTPEFIAKVGAKCWVRRKEGNKAELHKLPDDGISSTTELDGLRMGCLCVDGDYLLLSAWVGASAVWLSGDAALIKIHADNFIYTGKPTVNIPIKSKVTLRNAVLNSSLQLGENPTVVVEGSNSIFVDSFDSCIRCSGEIKITGHGSLNLTCESYSAAIGYGGVSQSYGRYVPNSRNDIVTKIIVDGIHLEVKSETPNFSMGSYGINNEIEIVLQNGGTVNGIPETTGKVKLDSVGTTCEGSTKIDGPAVYRITPFSDDLSGYKISAEPYTSPDNYHAQSPTEN